MISAPVAAIRKGRQIKDRKSSLGKAYAIVLFALVELNTAVIRASVIHGVIHYPKIF